MKRLIFFLLSWLSAAITTHAQVDTETWDVKYSNGIAAQVESQIITLEELRREIAPLIPEMRSKARSRQEFDYYVKQVTREILQNLIDRTLIVSEFNEKGYQIPQTYLQNEYDDYIIKEFNGERSEFLEFLHIQGKSDLQFRNELKESIIVNFMRNEMTKSQTEVSPQKIRDYYTENKNRFYEEAAVNIEMITLTPRPYESKDAMLQQANEIVAQLDAGEAFSELAQQHSQDDKRLAGGSWGWVNRNEMLPSLANAAFALQPTEHSQPIEQGDNLFILRVVEKREEGIQKLEEVRNKVELAITQQLARQAAEHWLERLRKKAYIRYFLDEADPRVNDSSPVEMKIGRSSKDETQAPPTPPAAE